MLENSLRIIIDTNLWISFLLSRKESHILHFLSNPNKYTVLFRVELFEELRDVLYRPKFAKVFGEARLLKFLALIKQKTLFIDVVSEMNVCRDKEDNFLLAMAKDGFADYLLTGDNDLLVLEKVGECQVLKLSQFLEIINQSE